MFGFLRRQKPKPVDPIAAYDAALEELEREGSAIRRSAATLLAVRSELSRTLEKQTAQKSELERRLTDARQQEQALVSATLARDLTHLEAQMAVNQLSLAKAETDAATLTASAQTLQQRQSELEAERASARARLALGQAIQTALVPQLRPDRMLALEAARDEVERAHALAEIYREEQTGKSG